MTDADAAALAPALAAMDPWARLEIRPEALQTYLSAEDPCSHRFSLWADEELAGLVSIRAPWLKGPYLELLAILPPQQSKGIGSAILRWMEATSEESARNLWVAASSFNTPAISFYQRHGFEITTTLPNLIKDGFDELLLRKQLR